MPKTNTIQVVMYPEGVIVGKVTSGRQRVGGKVRHVATDNNGRRIGTYDTFNDARAAVINAARATA